MKNALCVKFEHWPSEDQLAWRANGALADPFDDAHYGSGLSAETLDKTAKGYGRYLGFLMYNGMFDSDIAPLARVTRRRLAAYYKFLREAGNADYTIIGRFDELYRAMRILSPGKDVCWIRRPCGQTIYSMLPKAKRDILVPDSAVLLKWGIQMMETSGAKQTEVEQLCAFRDGLLISMLASRARRLRSMQLIRLGKELVWQGGVYRLELNATQVKTKKPDRIDFPAYLTAYINRYVNNIRPGLLAGRQCEQFWLGARGGPWTAKAIQGQILHHSRIRFGVAFGPHRFRHAIATTSAIADAGNPGLAAAVLGISSEIVKESYNRCGQIQAAQNFSKLMDARQLALRSKR